jgi:hypothetical protein
MMQRVRLTSVLLAGIGLNLFASASLWESRIVWAIAAGLVALLAGFLALGLRDAIAADRYLADHDG